MTSASTEEAINNAEGNDGLLRQEGPRIDHQGEKEGALRSCQVDVAEHGIVCTGCVTVHVMRNAPREDDIVPHPCSGQGYKRVLPLIN